MSPNAHQAHAAVKTQEGRKFMVLSTALGMALCSLGWFSVRIHSLWCNRPICDEAPPKSRSAFHTRHLPNREAPSMQTYVYERGAPPLPLPTASKRLPLLPLTHGGTLERNLPRSPNVVHETQKVSRRFGTVSRRFRERSADANRSVSAVSDRFGALDHFGGFGGLPCNQEARECLVSGANSISGGGSRREEWEEWVEAAAGMRVGMGRGEEEIVRSLGGTAGICLLAQRCTR